MILLGFYLFQRIKLTLTMTISLRGSCPWWPSGGELFCWPPPSWGWEGGELSLCDGKHREGHAYPHIHGARSQEPLPHCGGHQTSHAARSHRGTLQITQVLNHCPSPLAPPLSFFPSPPPSTFPGPLFRITMTSTGEEPIGEASGLVHSPAQHFTDQVQRGQEYLSLYLFSLLK